MQNTNYDCGCVHIPSHQSKNGSWQPPEKILCDACEAKLEREEQYETQREETQILEKAFHILEEYREKPELHPLFTAILMAGKGLDQILDHLEGAAQ
jgi:hypothetical protein